MNIVLDHSISQAQIRCVPKTSFDIPNLAGVKFNRLTLLKEAGRNKFGNKMAEFYCDCGSEVISIMAKVASGKIGSCGCLKKEWYDSITIHGHSTALGSTSEYRTWQAMRNRCTRKKDDHYANYGGRGIKVCERWSSSFSNFLEDMGRKPSRKHSLDRINNDGNYEPGNCRWALPAIQQNNRRDNRRFTILGRTQTVTQWCLEFKISRDAVFSRLKKGEAIDSALKRPLRRKL